MFWKSKSEKEIEMKAKSEERIRCEILYLDEIKKEKKIYREDLEDQKKELNSESNKKIRELETKFGLEISRLNNRIAFLEDENRRFLKAVSLISPYAYKLESIASSLAVESQDIAVEKARKLANINNAKHELETTIRKIEKLSPKINKLMNVNIEFVEGEIQ